MELPTMAAGLYFLGQLKGLGGISSSFQADFGSQGCFNKVKRTETFSASMPAW
jgi:hypothetical protein